MTAEQIRAIHDQLVETQLESCRIRTKLLALSGTLLWAEQDGSVPEGTTQRIESDAYMEAYWRRDPDLEDPWRHYE